MPTEEINILNIDAEPSQPEGFDVQLDIQQPSSPTLNLGVVLPIGEGGAIKSISVNGVEQPIIEGNVDIIVPTSTSQLLNDSGYITSSAITGKVDRTELAQVAFTGDYDDLQNKPEIPSLSGYATETYVGNAVSAHNESTTAHTDIRNEISAIDELIPAQAASDNQLADKNFVNSSIATSTATFRGTYNVVTDLNLHYNSTHSEIALKLGTEVSTADNNDYVFVQIPTSDSTPTEIASIERYKYNGSVWEYEYTLNNSGFTAAQWAAINSGITSTAVSQIATNTNDISNLQTSVNGKVSKTGDTMTGNLDMSDSAIVLSSSQSSAYKWDILSSSNTLSFTRMNLDGTGRSNRLSLSTDATFRRYVYGNWSSTEENRFLVHSEIDNPVISTSVTLVGGVTHLNELGSVDYATIALPSSPGTAEYNGSFTSTTSGDITVSLPLTFWQGETNIVAGRTYSFTIQNGRGFIIQMN